VVNLEGQVTWSLRCVMASAAAAAAAHMMTAGAHVPMCRSIAAAAAGIFSATSRIITFMPGAVLRPNPPTTSRRRSTPPRSAICQARARQQPAFVSGGEAQGVLIPFQQTGDSDTTDPTARILQPCCFQQLLLTRKK
jgi:hypothetical protein